MKTANEDLKLDVEPKIVYLVPTNEFSTELEEDLDKLSEKYKHLLLAPITRFYTADDF